MVQSRSFFERALKLDPDHVEALVGIASIDMSIAGFLLTDNVAERFVAAETALVKAISLAPHYAPAHAFLGCLQSSTNRAAQGIAECEHALALNPNLADAHAFIGVAKTFIGRAAETEADINEALRLSLAMKAHIDGWLGLGSANWYSELMPTLSCGYVEV